MVAGHDSRHAGYESDRFEIMRTVEMETWSESRLAHHNNMGPVYNISSEDCRAGSPENGFDVKQNGVIITSAASSKSSGSVPREADSPFADRRGH